MRPLVAGNWKMNGLVSSLAELAALREKLVQKPPACEVLVCPPFTLIADAARLVDGVFGVGGQNCHARPHGPHTGDISAEMLKDAGASHVILGHSERRHDHGETDAEVAAKAHAAWRAGLVAIICLGETLAQRESGEAHTICHSQLDGSVPITATPANTVIAYEPVWAIGTGRTATAGDIMGMHHHIRSCLADRLGAGARDMRILYGGSVKADNAQEILNLAEVNGALVGGASLKSDEFHRIIAAL
jgi:triosephosphate isomerase